MHPPLLPSGTRARRARNSAIRNSNRSRPEIPPGDCMASTSRFLQSTLPDTSVALYVLTEQRCAWARQEDSMFLTLFVVLLVMWMLGFFAFHVAGGLIYLLLIIAVISLVMHLFRGRTA